MERVQNNGVWSLFCPNEAPGLADCWGEEFEKLYTQYEGEVKIFFKKIDILFLKRELTCAVFCVRVRQRKLSKHRISGLKY